MDISKIRQALIGRKSRAGLVNMLFAILVGYLSTKGWLSEEMAYAIIGSGTVTTATNIWGVATEDAAKSNAAAASSNEEPK